MKKLICIIILVIITVTISAEYNILAQDYAKFITSRIDKTAEYLVKHEMAMPEMTSEENIAAIDSLKSIFKLYRKDIEDLPSFNGSSRFKKNGIKTITNIISLLGDDFPDLHEAGIDIIKNNDDMDNYNRLHDKIALKLNKIKSTYYQEFEIFLTDNHFYLDSLKTTDQINSKNIETFISDFMSAMNSGNTNLNRYILESRLQDLQATDMDVYSYQNFEFNLINTDPVYGLATIKLTLIDKPASYNIWFKIIADNNELKLDPAGTKNDKIIPWIYIKKN